MCSCAAFITVKSNPPQQHYCIFQWIRVNRNRNTLIGGWSACEPSCEDVHNSPPPPRDPVFSWACLWRQCSGCPVDCQNRLFSWGGGDWKSLWCVCLLRVVCLCVHVYVHVYVRVYMVTCMLLCVGVPMFVCACVWSVNVSLTSKVCVRVCFHACVQRGSTQQCA